MSHGFIRAAPSPTHPPPPPLPLAVRDIRGTFGTTLLLNKIQRPKMKFEARCVQDEGRLMARRRAFANFPRETFQSSLLLSLSLSLSLSERPFFFPI